jgi:hypothetical protein
MQALGKLSSAADVEAALGGLPRAYESWIDAELARSGARASLSKNRLEILDLLITRARTAAHRIRAGIDLLAHDPEVRQAFVFANRAMFFQARQRARRAKAPSADDPQWRLFQLAFILLSLADIALPEGHEGARSHRDDVELIFFPTGGGKTEAYLGLIAFTLLLRRLRGRHAPHGGEGVAVILRYTLRLLTLDQLERASTLICALETMRAGERYRALLGDRRFEIGLWVGSKASANRMLHFKEQLSAFRAGTGGNPCPLQLCPWCGEPLTSKSLTVETTPSGLERALVRCHNESCDFAKAPHSGAGLPLQFVDEQVYRDLPCFLVATVDKFAMLPWRGETGMLFGRVTHREPQGGSYYGPPPTAPRSPRHARSCPACAPRAHRAGRAPPHLGPARHHGGPLRDRHRGAVHRGQRARGSPRSSPPPPRCAAPRGRSLALRPPRGPLPAPGTDEGETFFARVDRARRRPRSTSASPRAAAR